FSRPVLIGRGLGLDTQFRENKDTLIQGNRASLWSAQGPPVPRTCRLRPNRIDSRTCSLASD
ncbi:MAG: hypothetical protein P8J75_03255, partial [Actinomycetota bacterium]|nr:hypothetical protein [Actinomycetota bacterium]